MKIRHKKILTVLAAALVIAACVFCFACGKKAGSKNVTCTFVFYDDQTTTVTGEKGEEIDFPAAERAGFVFDGWYMSADFMGSPVTNAKFEQNVTYYAKWEKGYALMLDADGGSIAGLDTAQPIYVKANAVIADIVNSYLPARGEHRFAFWKWGDEKLTQTHTMPATEVTLTAVYEAKYTVHAYLQKLEEDGYEYIQNYITDYALIGEELSVPDVKGFSHSKDYDSETDDLTIGERQEDNVFTLHYDRNRYIVTISQNNPLDKSETSEQKLLFGSELTPGEAIFAAPEGCRFLGWSTKGNGTIDDCADSFIVDGDMTVYAVWNKGYSDMFGGEDYVFLQDGKPEGSAVLSRGGWDIPGEYNAKREWYEFGSETVVCVKLNDNGTFVLRASRNGAYTLFENGELNADYRLTVTDWDDLTYICVKEGEGFTRKGKYVINEDGNYEARFNDGSSFVFTVGTYGGEQVFAIRGKEFDFGVMALLGNAYPLLMLDGFGTAAVMLTPEEQAYYQYTIDGDVVTLMSSDGQTSVIRVTQGLNNSWYDFYNASVDKTYTQGADSLTLDGCRAAEYIDARGVSHTGNYALESSVFGGYIVTVATRTQTYRFRIYEDGDNACLEVKESTYAEYGFVNADRKHVKVPYLVINGNGASMYDADLNELSRGSFTKSGKWNLYAVSGDVADSAENKNKTMLIYLDMSKGIPVYSIVAQGMNNPPDDLHYTEYAGEKGSTLTIVSAFAVYANANGGIIAAGVYQMYQYFENHFVMTTADGSERYFSVSDSQPLTFKVLQSEPQRLLLVKDGFTYSTQELLIDGSVADNGRPVAVYSEYKNGVTQLTEGTLTQETENGLSDEPFTVFTFTATEGGKSFRFVKWSEESEGEEAWYFSSFEDGAPVLLTTYYMLGDDNGMDRTVFIAPTDGGKLVYSDGETQTQGAYTKAQYTFGDKTVTVFAFAPTEGDGFSFVLEENYFRIVADTETYSDGDEELLLDSKTHTVKYISGDTVVFLEYLTVETPNESYENAVRVVLNGEDRYFDIKSDNTFSLRGTEEGAYLFIENGIHGDSIITFDGHGKVLITVVAEDGESEAEEITGSYTCADDIITVVAGQSSYSGKLGEYTLEGSVYPAFFRTGAKVGGKYLDKATLSVLNLDDEGRAVKYDTYGNKDTGTYVVLDDGLVYYRNDAATDSAMYKLADKYAQASSYAETFYASDFASIVFKNGIVRFNNKYETYFMTESGNIYTYALPQDGETPNKYGFVKTKYDISDTLRFTDPETNKERTYTRYDKLSVTLSSGGDTLEFTPSGDAEFTVDAKYKKGSSVNVYQVSVRYEKGEPVVLLSQDHADCLNGSANKYTFTRNYDLTVDFAAKTFSYNAETYAYGLTAYDYTYVQMVLSGSNDPMLDYKFGILTVEGSVNGGVTAYSVSGYMYYMYDSQRNPIAFTGGTLSPAGITHSEYGHLFACEFTAGEETYILHFFLTYNKRLDAYTYIVYSCVRVTDNVMLSGGTLINGTFVYTTGFKFLKPKTDISEQDEYYKIGEAFIPTLKVNGKLLCVASKEEKTDAWVFIVREYAETTYIDYYYYLDVKNGSVTAGAALNRYRATYHRVSGKTYSVCVLYDDNDAVFTVYSLNYTDGTVKTAVSCSNSGNVYTVTTDTGETFKFSVTSGGVEVVE